jgi:hypothetical protein
MDASAGVVCCFSARLFKYSRERGRVVSGAGSVELDHVYLPHVTALLDFVV